MASNRNVRTTGDGLNVFPCLLSGNHADVVVAHSKQFCDCSAGNNSWDIHCADGFHLFVCKLCAAMSFTLGRFEAILLKCVAHVIRMGSLKQMGWVKTRRVIAGVTDFLAVRNWPFRQRPNKSVDAPDFVFEPHYAVTARRCTTSPFPAIPIDLAHGHYELQKLTVDVAWTSVPMVDRAINKKITRSLDDAGFIPRDQSDEESTQRERVRTTQNIFGFINNNIDIVRTEILFVGSLGLLSVLPKVPKFSVELKSSKTFQSSKDTSLSVRGEISISIDLQKSVFDVDSAKLQLLYSF